MRAAEASKQILFGQSDTSLLALRTFHRSDTIGLYDGMVLYRDLQKDRITSYGNGHYTCSTEQFKTQAV